MPLFVSVLLINVAAVWLLMHWIARRKLRNLRVQLPTAYQSAIVAPTLDSGSPRLIPLSIDLTRKKHSTVPFDALSPSEQRLALHAYAVEELPKWVVNITKRRLRRAERGVVNQLQYIKASRPDHKPVHFGAIRHQQRLRSAPET